MEAVRARFRDSTPSPTTLTKVAKRHRHRQGEARAGQGEYKPAAEIGNMEPLEDGLEDEPLADEAGGGRHRRRGSLRQAPADTEEPMSSGAGIGECDSRPVARRNPSAARKSPPFASA